MADNNGFSKHGSARTGWGNGGTSAIPLRIALTSCIDSIEQIQTSHRVCLQHNSRPCICDALTLKRLLQASSHPKQRERRLHSTERSTTSVLRFSGVPTPVAGLKLFCNWILEELESGTQRSPRPRTTGSPHTACISRPSKSGTRTPALPLENKTCPSCKRTVLGNWWLACRVSTLLIRWKKLLFGVKSLVGVRSD
jgi:hypothetical protein